MDSRMRPIPMPAQPPDSPARFHAVLPCAGNGSRAGTEGPKQYEPLAGRPWCCTRWMRWRASIARRSWWWSRPATIACRKAGLFGRRARRRHAGRAVANGLDELHRRGAADDDWVLVHDAARCLVTPALVDRLIDACAGDEVGGCWPSRWPTR
jgi:2-C-methyl-D-erythritol 4-phosphate cytidylyltransferase